MPLLDPDMRRRLGRWRVKVRRVTGRPRWGNLLRQNPFSPVYGAERGTPADRHYLRAFVEANATCVSGAVMEVERDEWTSAAVAAGGGPIRSLELVDIDPGNAAATFITDLSGPAPFGDRSFDCQIVLQTLQYLVDPVRAIQSLYRALKPGGTLLLSAPAIARVDDMCGPDGDLWHLTPAGLRRLLSCSLPDATTEVAGYGSLAVATGFLHGVSAEEMPKAYRWEDRRFPVVSCAVVRKAPA